MRSHLASKNLWKLIAYAEHKHDVDSEMRTDGNMSPANGMSRAHAHTAGLQAIKLWRNMGSFPGLSTVNIWMTDWTLKIFTLAHKLITSRKQLWCSAYYNNNKPRRGISLLRLRKKDDEKSETNPIEIYADNGDSKFEKWECTGKAIHKRLWQHTKAETKFFISISICQLGRSRFLLSIALSIPHPLFRAVHSIPFCMNTI